MSPRQNIPKISYDESATREEAESLTKALNEIIENKFADTIAPPAYVTPTGIKPLDAILGGGIVSSAPVIFSSASELGKSTFALQFAKRFLDLYDNALVVYFDIERASVSAMEEGHIPKRIDELGIDKSRILYKTMMLTLEGVFAAVDTLINVKQEAEAKLKKEYKLLIIWDSVASTRPAKLDEVDASDPNALIGYRARVLTQLLAKYMPLIALNRVTFIIIDQVRAHIAREMAHTRQDSMVGDFGEFKAATKIYALEHVTNQWLYFRYAGHLLPGTHPYGNVDGWKLEVFIEKNKVTASRNAITVIFDKKVGFHKFWTEWYFLTNPTPIERIYEKKKGKKVDLRSPIITKGGYVKLCVVDPSTEQVVYESKNFRQSEAYDLYLKDDEFRKWFDTAVDINMEYRFGKMQGEYLDDTPQDST